MRATPCQVSTCPSLAHRVCSDETTAGAASPLVGVWRTVDSCVPAGIMTMAIRAVSVQAFVEGCQWLVPVDSDDFDVLRFDGRPRSNVWTPVRMRRITRDGTGAQGKESDFPPCSGGEMLIVSRAARDWLRPELERHGELLPLHCDDGQFWAVNVTTIVDALDEDATDFVRSPSSGRIIWVERPVFKPSILTGLSVFKVPQTPKGLIYFTDRFVELVRMSGLKGLDFERVWAAP